jgi:Xaa-Pro aminopeptidase
MDHEAMFGSRLDRVRAALAERDLDALLLSVGPDLPWLVGYEAMPLERLTMLVVPRQGTPSLVVPRLEVARVVHRPALFDLVAWDETEDPVAKVAELAGPVRAVAIGNRTWSQFLLALQRALPAARWEPASTVVGELRRVKEPAEVEALARAAAGVDRVAAALRGGEIPLVGRTEAEVSAELGRRILAEGHARVNFAIVASGPNAASPHHHPSDRVIQPGEIVLCDFGGTTAEEPGVPGYCSDITRCVHTGEPPAELAEAYAALRDAQALAVAGARVGTPAEAVDAIARARLAAAGLAEHFIHRLGHGIGVEEHEDPYLVAGNGRPLEAGNTFSVEPGFYLERRWGARIEDIVVATDDGPRVLNQVGRDLAVVDA